MGKQSQIIIFRVVSGRPDVGRCLRLRGPWLSVTHSLRTELTGGGELGSRILLSA